jgi:hypothetical protein
MGAASAALSGWAHQKYQPAVVNLRANDTVLPWSGQFAHRGRHHRCGNRMTSHRYFADSKLQTTDYGTLNINVMRALRITMVKARSQVTGRRHQQPRISGQRKSAA